MHKLWSNMLLESQKKCLQWILACDTNETWSFKTSNAGGVEHKTYFVSVLRIRSLETIFLVKNI